MALHHCPEDWDGGWKQNSEMPQHHDHPTSPVLLTQLPSLRHSLSHRGPPLAEWWGTCGTGEMGEEHRGAPDVCVTTSGNAGTNRQKGGRLGGRPPASGVSCFPTPSLQPQHVTPLLSTHSLVTWGQSFGKNSLTVRSVPWEMRIIPMA